MDANARRGRRVASETRTVEYYRCWSGNGGDSGQWDTDFIEIPKDTPDDELDKAVVKACEEVAWKDERPLFVGYYCDSDPLDEEE